MSSLSVGHPVQAGSTITVELAGAADMDNQRELHTALRGAVRRARRGGAVLVDCAALSFCASAGLNQFLYARKVARDRGVRFALTGVNGQPARLLELTGTAELFGGG